MLDSIALNDLHAGSWLVISYHIYSQAFALVL